MKRFLTFLATLALVAAPWIAIGQGFITSHSIPIGQGAGVQGWGIGGPCATSQALVWPNANSDPVCGSVSGGGGNVTSPFNLLLGPAHLFVGNATSIANDVQLSGDCTIATSGQITCTKTNNVAFGSFATQTTSLVNSQLLNSAITVNSQTCTLGSSCTVPTNIASATTGSGNVVLQTSAYVVGATIASPTIVSAFSAVGLVTNSDLTSSATVVNTINCVLGGGCTVPTNISSSPSITNNGVTCTLGGSCFTGSTSGTTGSGNVVLQSSAYIVTATIASPTIVSAFTAVGLVTNADLVNASTTPNGTTCTLGLTCALTASASSITAGTTSVYSGATSGILFSDSSKTLSQYTLQGIGPKAQMSSGAIISGNCVKYDANGNTVDAGAACGSGGSSTGPTEQKFTSGSATYTTPVNTIWIEVRMVGGGGGGGGVGTTTATSGTNGTSSTFGTSLLAAGGGFGGVGDAAITAGNQLGGIGGTASLGSGPFGLATPGNGGGLSIDANSIEGFGAASCLGGAPVATGKTSASGASGATNSGAGGAGASQTASTLAGGGGGSGGCVYAIIVTPAASYAVTVGASGPGGTGTGVNASSGGAGGSGIIDVIEHYNH